MGLFTPKLANKSTSLPPQLASHSRCSSPCTERARDERFFVPCPNRLADDSSQYTLAEVEKRVSWATDVRESTSRQGTGLDLTSKTSPVRNLPQIWLSQKFTVTVVPVMGLDDKKIAQIACGQQHSIALDEEGYAHGFILRGLVS